MGNTSGKPQPRPRNKKDVSSRSADRPATPGKPYLATDLEATPDVLTIRWDAPPRDGGTQITGYLIEHRRSGSPHWVKATPLMVRVPELTLSGLEPGWRYQFRVFAENIVGISEPSELSELLTVTLQRSAIIAPRFTQELRDTIALENDKVDFVAHFIGQPLPKLCWFKDGFEIFSSRRTRILTETDRSILTIHQSAITDEGEIKCTATNKAGHASSKAKLTLEAPPNIRLPRNYEDGLLFEIGEVIRLKVSVAGLPSPLVFWTHNGESIQENERYEIENSDKFSTLRISEAMRNDRGEYHIKAVNKLGADVASLLVTVTDKPSPPGKAKVIMTLGRSVTLSWNTPHDDGGCKIGNYIVEYYRLGWNVWLKAATSKQLSTILGDLIEGSEYKFRIKAESPFGVSEPSEESDLVFIPDPKRGILVPVPRSKSQPRGDLINPDAPIAARRKNKSRSHSSSRGEAFDDDLDIPIIGQALPTKPDRNKIKSPPKTPDLSPRAVRKENLNDSFFDRSSMARDLAYGSPLNKKIEYAPPVPPHQPLYKPAVPIHKQEINSFKPSIAIPQKQVIQNIKQEMNKASLKEIPLPSKPLPSKPVQQKEVSKPSPIPPIKIDEVVAQPPVEIKKTTIHIISNQRQRSPSPVPPPVNQIDKSRSPSPRRMFRDTSPQISAFSKESSPQLRSIGGRSKLSRDNSENLGGSSEFMMVLYPSENHKDMGSTSDFGFDPDNNISIAPPLSLSAPELGAEPPLFENLRLSASSTELLHERAMFRFYEEALAEEEDMKRRLLKVEEHGGSGLIPKIQINNEDANNIVGLERKHSIRRRLSAGGTIPLQVVMSQRRQSLRNSSDFTDIFEMKLQKFPLSIEEKREIMKNRQRSHSEEREEEEFEKVRTRTSHKIGLPRKKKISIVEEEIWDPIEGDDYEESISEEDSESEDERFKNQVKIKDIAADSEEEIYHPRMMMAQPQPQSQNKSKYEEPFEILTRPAKLPDANFVPKPILKKKDNGDNAMQPSVQEVEARQEEIERKENQARRDSLLEWMYQQKANNSQTFTKRGSLPDVAVVLPERPPLDTSAIARISSVVATGFILSQPMLRKKEEEESKVVIDHYGDIVRTVAQQRRLSQPEMNPVREALKKAAAEQAQKLKDEEDANELKLKQEEEIKELKLKQERDAQELKSSNDKVNAINERFKELEKRIENNNHNKLQEQPARSATPIFKQNKIEGTNGTIKTNLFSNHAIEAPVDIKEKIETIRAKAHMEKEEVTPMRGRDESRYGRAKRNVSQSKSPRRLSDESTKKTHSRTVGESPTPARSTGTTKKTQSRSNSAVRGSSRSNSLVKPPSRSNSKPRNAPKSKSPSPVPFLLRKPKMCEIMTQTSTSIDPYPSKGTQISLPVPDTLKQMAQIKVRTTIDYVTDLAMFAVACWLFLFSNELLAIPVLLVAVYRQLKEEMKKRIPNWIKRRWNKEKK